GEGNHDVGEPEDQGEVVKLAHAGDVGELDRGAEAEVGAVEQERRSEQYRAAGGGGRAGGGRGGRSLGGSGWAACHAARERPGGEQSGNSPGHPGPPRWGDTTGLGHSGER